MNVNLRRGDEVRFKDGKERYKVLGISLASQGVGREVMLRRNGCDDENPLVVPLKDVRKYERDDMDKDVRNRQPLRSYLRYCYSG